MKVYTGEYEVWEPRSWVPARRQPVVIYRYTMADLDGWLDTEPAKLKAAQSSGYLVKSHQVTRTAESHHAKRYTYKGSASVRRS